MLETRPAKSDPRSCQFDLRRLYARRTALGGQLQEDVERLHSGGLFRGLHSWRHSHDTNNRNSPGVEPAGFIRTDLASFLSRPIGKQLSVFRYGPGMHTVSANLYARLHTSRRNLKLKS